MKTVQEFHRDFAWSRKEYGEAVAAVLKYRPPSKMRLFTRAAGWGVVIIVFAPVLLALVLGEMHTLVTVLPWALLALFMVALFKWGLPWSQSLQYPKKGRGTIQFWANGEEVGQSSPLGSSRSPWRAIEQVVETDRLFLFYFTETAAFYLPKRVLEGEALSGFREFVAEKVEVRDVRNGSGV